MRDAAAAWARALRLPSEPSRQQPTGHLTRISFSGPGELATVTLFVSKGAGHTWLGSRLPLSLRLILGRSSNEIDATAEIWRSASASPDLSR